MVLLRHQLSIYVKFSIDLFVIVNESINKNRGQGKIHQINVETYKIYIILKIKIDEEFRQHIYRTLITAFMVSFFIDLIFSQGC